MVKAVFLDRDGVINQEVNYLTDPTDIILLPRVAEAVKRLNGAGFKVIVITNQSAVARGMLTENALQKINNKIVELLEAQGAKIDKFYYCPHHPDFTGSCECRKPKPGMLLEAAKELGIDLKCSYMVGDTKSDIRAGRAAGCTTILVLTGYGKEDRDEVEADYVEEDLSAAIKLIVEELEK